MEENEKTLKKLRNKYRKARIYRVDDCYIVDRKKTYKMKYFGVLREFDEVPLVFDLSGNVFFSNFDSKKSAEKFVQSQKELGVTAFVGPVAPSCFGVSMKSRYPHGAGVYFFKPDMIETKKDEHKKTAKKSSNAQLPIIKTNTPNYTRKQVERMNALRQKYCKNEKAEEMFVEQAKTEGLKAKLIRDLEQRQRELEKAKSKPEQE